MKLSCEQMQWVLADAHFVTLIAFATQCPWDSSAAHLNRDLGIERLTAQTGILPACATAANSRSRRTAHFMLTVWASV